MVQINVACEATAKWRKPQLSLRATNGLRSCTNNSFTFHITKSRWFTFSLCRHVYDLLAQKPEDDCGVYWWKFNSWVQCHLSVHVVLVSTPFLMKNSEMFILNTNFYALTKTTQVSSSVWFIFVFKYVQFVHRFRNKDTVLWLINSTYRNLRSDCTEVCDVSGTS